MTGKVDTIFPSGIAENWELSGSQRNEIRTAPLLAILRILILVPLGYIIAIVTAALIVGAAASNTYDADALMLVVPYFFTVSAIGAAAFAPSAIAIAAAEILSLRSVFYFLAIGGGLGIVANHMNITDPSAFAAFDRAELVFPAAGFAGGFVYWLIAGRLSGLFNLRRPLPPVRKDEPDRERAEDAGENPVDRPPRDG
jgi:hypothetical protein